MKTTDTNTAANKAGRTNTANLHAHAYSEEDNDAIRDYATASAASGTTTKSNSTLIKYERKRQVATEAAVS